MKTTRKRYSTDFKVRIAMEAIWGDVTPAADDLLGPIITQCAAEAGALTVCWAIQARRAGFSGALLGTSRRSLTPRRGWCGTEAAAQNGDTTSKRFAKAENARAASAIQTLGKPYSG